MPRLCKGSCWWNEFVDWACRPRVSPPYHAEVWLWPVVWLHVVGQHVAHCLSVLGTRVVSPPLSLYFIVYQF